MNVGEPDKCICGRTTAGSAVCPMHRQDFLKTPDIVKAPVDNIRRFMSHEQEAELRVMLRNAYRKEGIMALFQIIGEMVASMQVTNMVIGEVIEEKEKGK